MKKTIITQETMWWPGVVRDDGVILACLLVCIPSPPLLHFFPGVTTDMECDFIILFYFFTVRYNARHVIKEVVEFHQI